MSFSLPDIDLTGKVAGNNGQILLQNMGISAGGVSANPTTFGKMASLYMRNDSGCGLGITLKDTGHQFSLGAGEWILQPIPPGESAILYIVKYVLPSPPVSLLMIDYYAPGETPPQTSTLGNSPVGIGGSVTTSGSTLSNEGAAANTKVVDIGTATFADLLDIFNDHFLWKVQQSGVAHQVLAGNNAGNPLQLGQAGDITEVLGQLTVDQAVTLSAIGLLTHILGTLTVDQTALITGILTLTAQPRLTAKKIADGSGNSLVDWSSTGVFLKGNPASQSNFHYQADGTNTDWTMSAISKFSGAGTGTFSHGLTVKGVATLPDIIIPVQNVAGSETMGYSALTTTTVAIQTGAGQAWVALAIKL